MKSNQNDVADAEAICEVLQRPGMRFVAVKTVEQQALLSLHRARQGLVRARTAQANRSSGGKPTLLGISKRGDAYLRTLLIHGARAVMRAAQRKHTYSGLLHELLKRRNPNVAAVALANENARIAWALLAHDRPYARAT